MELYQETRRYNSTSSWSPSCNRRSRARADAEREREKKTREIERKRKRSLFCYCASYVFRRRRRRRSFCTSWFPFLPGCGGAFVVALSLRNFDVSDFVIFLSGALILFTKCSKRNHHTYHAYFLNLKDSRGRFGVRRRREGVHAGHGRVVWRQNVAHRGEEAHGG